MRTFWWDTGHATHKTTHYDCISSTQDIARACVIDPSENSWHWIVAEHQSGGYGQRDKQWNSPKGGLYTTAILPWPEKTPVSVLSLVVALGVSKVCEDYGLSPSIKWINDIFVYDKKVSGTLIEDQGIWTNGLRRLLIGIGLNVNATPIERTSLSACLGRPVPLQEVVQLLQDHLPHVLYRFVQEGPSFFVPEINQRLLHVGKPVFFQKKTALFHGTLLGISESGGLLLEGCDPLGLKEGQLLTHWNT